MNSRLVWTVLSLGAFVALWAVAAELIDHRHFPSPAKILAVVVSESHSGQLWVHLGATLVRVAASFLIAMFIGSAIGLLLGTHRLADKFFDSWLVLFLNLPALVIITLSVIWLGSTETAAITAVAVNKIPNAAVTMREGARSLSRDLAEMATMYRFGWWRTLRHVTLPQLAPFFAAAARSGLSLVWKIVLVVEALGGLSTGVGHQMHIAYQNFDVAQIMGYALAFIAVVQIIEIGVLQPLQARVNRWRR